MRAQAGPRWLGVLLVVVLAGGAVLLVVLLAGADAARLHPLSARLPLATAGTVASPVLSGLLGIGAGLLAARRTEWINRRVRALVLAGSCACLVALTLTGALWFAVQGELLTLAGTGPAGSAGASAVSTLLLPATAVIFGAAGIIAVRIRAVTRDVALAGHVLTAYSWGLPTTGRIIRRVLRRTLPTVLVVLTVDVVVLYAGSLAVQAVITAPSLATALPLLPAESLPVVLVVTLLCILALIVTVVPLASAVLRPPPSPLRPAAPGLRARPGTSALPSTSFRSSDFLDIRDLRLHPGCEPGAEAEPLAGISLTVARGESLAVVGDHADGASLLCHAIAGLPPLRCAISSGSILFDGTELVGLSERQFRRLRGHRIGFLAAPGTDRLDPEATIGAQLAGLTAERPGGPRHRARAETLALLTDVGIDDAVTVFAAYPHELSVATAQRVLLAGAIAREPRFLIADHPTEGLSAGDEADFLDVLHTLQVQHGFTLIVASARVEIVVRCDRVAVMQEGVIVEHASAHDVITAPQHPHSRQLLAADR